MQLVSSAQTPVEKSPAVMDFKMLDKTPKVDEETTLKELDPGYYTEDFNSMLYSLKLLPAGFDAHDIEDLVCI